MKSLREPPRERAKLVRFVGMAAKAWRSCVGTSGELASARVGGTVRRCSGVLALIFVALTLAVTPARADLAAGLAAYDAGDYAKAYAEWLPLVRQGNAFAQTNLGFMYGKGHGVTQNYAEAVRWYRLAADQGNARARSNLGITYFKGRGVPQDYIQAHMWWNLAASRQTDPAMRDDAIKNRDIVAGKMTPAQIAEAQRLASAWRPK